MLAEGSYRLKTTLGEYFQRCFATSLTTTLRNVHAAGEIGLVDGSSRPEHSPKRVIRENRTVESDGLCPSLLCLTKGPPPPQKEERAKTSAVQPLTTNESNEHGLSEARMLRTAL